MLVIVTIYEMVELDARRGSVLALIPCDEKGLDQTKGTIVSSLMGRWSTAIPQVPGNRTGSVAPATSN